MLCTHQLISSVRVCRGRLCRWTPGEGGSSFPVQCPGHTVSQQHPGDVRYSTIYSLLVHCNVQNAHQKTPPVEQKSGVFCVLSAEATRTPNPTGDQGSSNSTGDTNASREHHLGDGIPTPLHSCKGSHPRQFVPGSVRPEDKQTGTDISCLSKKNQMWVVHTGSGLAPPPPPLPPHTYLYTGQISS